MKRYIEVMDRLFGQEIVSEAEEYFEDKLKKIKEVSEIKMVGDSRVDFEYSTYMVSLMGIDSVECTYTDISVQRGVSGLEERVVSSLQDVGISKA